MSEIPQKIQERLRIGIRRFKPVLKSAKLKDCNKADTTTIVIDILSALLGYDKYVELSSELANREAVYDLGIHLNKRLSIMIRVTPIGIALDEMFLKATAHHAIKKKVEWLILTNGVHWQIHHVESGTVPETPMVLAFDFLKLLPARASDLAALNLLSREGHQKAGLIEFHAKLQLTSRYHLGAAILSEPVLTAIRRELRHVNPSLKIDTGEIRTSLKERVIKRDVASDVKTEEAGKVLAKARETASKEKIKRSRTAGFSKAKSSRKKAVLKWSPKTDVKTTQKSKDKEITPSFASVAPKKTGKVKPPVKKALKKSKLPNTAPRNRARILKWGKTAI